MLPSQILSFGSFVTFYLFPFECFCLKYHGLSLERSIVIFYLFSRIPSQILCFEKYGDFICFQGFIFKYCDLENLVLPSKIL